MSVQPKAGEMLVGAYLKLVEECEVVAYGQHSPVAGEQMEVDVVGLDPAAGTVLVCEVATHLGGLGYGTARENRERVARKFRNATTYVDRGFPETTAARFQFWSPVVGPKSVGELREAATAFESETGYPLELVVNERYAERVEELRSRAAATEAQRGELGFRFLQILEHLPG